MLGLVSNVCIKYISINQIYLILMYVCQLMYVVFSTLDNHNIWHHTLDTKPNN
jgi:hypothetical protein